MQRLSGDEHLTANADLGPHVEEAVRHGALGERGNVQQAGLNVDLLFDLTRRRQVVTQLGL